jgi:tungstate transport system ATP-binding protein
MEEILRLKGIKFSRGNFELDIDDFSVKKGEIFCLLGENGSGKTTFFFILSLLIRPDSGEIWIMGKRVESIKDAGKDVTMVFQKPVLFSGSVYDNIILPIKGNKRKFEKDKLELLMEKFGISKIKEKKGKEISGGEAQRVCLVRALLLNPKILVLDEPFSSIDPISSHEIISEVIKIAREEGMTIIFSTHDPEESVHAERIGIMDNGKIVQIGSFKDIFYKPSNDRIAKILGSVNVIFGEIEEWRDGVAKVRSNGGIIEVVTDIKEGDVAIYLRPENVVISREISFSSARNNFKGEVREIFDKGLRIEIILDCGFPLISHVTRPSFENLDLKVGDIVYASFKASSVHLVRR